MKRVFVFLVLFFTFAQGSAFAGLGFGVRAGVVSNYDNPALKNLPTLKRDWIKDMNMLGAHLEIETLPIIDLEISGEYFWRSQDVSIGLGSDTISGEFKVQDYSLNATARYVFSTLVIKPYLGAGVGLHVVSYKFAKDEYFSELGIPGVQVKPGYHFSAGLLLDAPVLPLDIFAEGRYSSIQTEKEATGFLTWILGITLIFP